MTDNSPIGKVKAANARYLDIKRQTDEAQDALFDACADAARAGHTADELAQYVEFGPTYIRKQVRARGVEPAKGGPKPRSKA